MSLQHSLPSSMQDQPSEQAPFSAPFFNDPWLAPVGDENGFWFGGSFYPLSPSFQGQPSAQASSSAAFFHDPPLESIEDQDGVWIDGIFYPFENNGDQL